MMDMSLIATESTIIFLHELIDDEIQFKMLDSDGNHTNSNRATIIHTIAA